MFVLKRALKIYVEKQCIFLSPPTGKVINCSICLSLVASSAPLSVICRESACTKEAECLCFVFQSENVRLALGYGVFYFGFKTDSQSYLVCTLICLSNLVSSFFLTLKLTCLLPLWISTLSTRYCLSVLSSLVQHHGT